MLEWKTWEERLKRSQFTGLLGYPETQMCEIMVAPFLERSLPCVLDSSVLYVPFHLVILSMTIRPDEGGGPRPHS